MSDAGEIKDAIEARLHVPAEDMLAELLEASGEDFAVPQDRVQAGLKVLYAYLGTIRTKLCDSETRALLKQDFEKSGPALAAMLAADAYLTALGVPAQATVGALVLKLGVDRLCSG